MTTYNEETDGICELSFLRWEPEVMSNPILLLARASAPLVTEALREAGTNTSLRERSARMGEAIRKEDGIQRAVTVVDTVYPPGSRKTSQ